MTSIDQLLEHPEQISGITVSEGRRLLVSLSALMTALAARSCEQEPVGNQSVRTTPVPDRLLTVSQVAEILGVERSWVYRHNGEWPFRVQLSRKTVRFSERGLRKWMVTKSR